MSLPGMRKPPAASRVSELLGETISATRNDGALRLRKWNVRITIGYHAVYL